MPKLLKTVSIITAVLMLVGPNAAMAEECLEPVAVTTPCAGVLLPNSAAEQGLKCLRVEVPRLKLDIEFLTKEKASFEKLHLSLITAERKRSEGLEKQIEFLLKSNTAPKWYESPAFHFAIGFVTASAITVGITYAVNND